MFRSRPSTVVAPLSPVFDLDALVNAGWRIGPIGDGATAVGGIDGAPRAEVDRRGVLTVDGAWSIDWWVGADDRWRIASGESSVRQSLVPGTPIVESAMRIPGGDAVHRAFAVPGFICIEVENRSAVPFALAMCVRPFGERGPAPIHRAGVSGTEVVVDGRVALVLPVPPAHAAGGSLASGDVAAVVLAGGAGRGPVEVSCDAGMATVAVVVAVAHRTTTRMLVPLPVGGTPPRPLGTWPSLDRVVDGWAAVARARPRMELPDAQIQGILDVARSKAMGVDRDDVGAAGDAAVVVAAALGFGDIATADEIVRSLWMRERTDGSFDEPGSSAGRGRRAAAGRGAIGGPHLYAVGDLLLHRPDAHLAADLAPGIALAAAYADEMQMADNPWAKAGRARALRALGAYGHGHAAMALAAGPLDVDVDIVGLLRGASAGAEHSGPIHAAAALRRAARMHDAATVAPLVGQLISDAGPTIAFAGGAGGDDPTARAAVLLALRSLLVVEHEAGLDLVPVHPVAWRGGAIDVHALPTSFGVLSFAVRWHGDRPALLWDLKTDLAPRLRCPGLDPSWSSDDARGEVLLAAPATTSAPEGFVGRDGDAGTVAFT